MTASGASSTNTSLPYEQYGRNVETAAIVDGYAERTGAVVLAEGIETETGLETAKALGARWRQGWLLGPGPLTAIAGRRAHGSPVLRSPSRISTCLPAARSAWRPWAAGAEPAIVRRFDELIEYLLSMAASGGSHTVILGAYADRVVGEAWLARWRVPGDPGAFIGLVGPEVPGADWHRATVATVSGRHRFGLGRGQFGLGGRAVRATCLRRDYGARGHPRTKSGARGGAKANVHGRRRHRTAGTPRLRQCEGEAVVPIALAAHLLAQASRRRCDQGPGSTDQ